MYIGELFNKYGSDKDRNGYSPFYDLVFGRIRSQVKSVAEVGIGTLIEGAPSSMVGYCLPGYSPGGSLRAWADYFPNAEIHGFDIQPDTQFKAERITTHLLNSLEPLPPGFTHSTDEYGVVRRRYAFDIIIDDGSHRAMHQLRTLQNFLPLLRQGGFYVIEDVIPTSAIQFAEFIGSIKYILSDTRAHISVSDQRNLVLIGLDPDNW